MDVADYIIVGGGSAGCVIAARLSEDPATRVILLEAGGEAGSFMVQMPAGFAKMLLNDRFDWQYEQLPDPSIGNRRFIWSAGKMLGGGSSLNGQVYIRGTRNDFDHWLQLGATGWGWDDVWPYFLRCEHWHGPANQNHGSHGPVAVSPMRDPHPLCAVFMDACAQVGLGELEDYNGGAMEGSFLTQATQLDGWRCSTEKAYLRDARKRPNLRVITNADVETIIMENSRAVGVSYRRDGQYETVRAAREVIVSAGTMGSPALLMRSGIGPADSLRESGIEIIQDHPEVGENLQEHPGVTQNKFVNRPTINSQLRPHHIMRDLVRFLWNRTGPLGAPAVQAMAMVRTHDGLEEPDAQIHFLPLAYNVEQDTISSAEAEMPKEPCVSIIASLTRPKSRGRIKLGADKRPVIDHQLLGDERDVASMVKAMKFVNGVFATSAMQQIIIGDRSPDPIPANDEEWTQYIRDKALVTYHPVGSCRMGADDRAVVDPQCRVRGIGGLRVADASIMPRITSGNTNATAIMIGEKVAETIRSGR
ncbi:MAG: GMC family oxidoreductase N-terminal domain-containing protein [Sphingomonas sp.]|nr:GMC family oxidoreductase N-terminal domain-containing protein [Sphingomonas sp.]